MKKEDVEQYRAGSQSGILYKYILNCNRVFLLGCFLFVFLLIINHSCAIVSIEQSEDIFYLNQFRNGSKNLTMAVEGYVASAKQTYEEKYYYELNIEQNRENAIEALEKNNLTPEELGVLKEIIKLSDDLIPIEKQAFEMTSLGKKEDARAMIFSSYYYESINTLSEKIDDLIDRVCMRLDKEQTNMRILQVITELIFGASLVFLMLTIVKTIRFARTEILHPVMKMSEQLMYVSKGDLHKKLELEEDESEVGSVATAIRIMKENWSDMIYEIAYSLEEMSRGNYVLDFNMEYVGEFVTIKESLEEIVDGMKKIIKTISDASNDINAGAIEISKAADSLSEACASQAQDVSNIILYLDGMSEMIRANERDAEEAVKISNLSKSTIDLEEHRIHKLKSTIEDASHCIEAMAAIVEMTSFSEETQTLIDNTLITLNEINNNTDEAMNELEDMKLGAQETTERIERIVLNFNTEIDNIDKIGENLNQLAGIVDNNSATSEETAAISEQQKSHVANLIELINNIKI